MKQQILSNLKYLAFGLVLAVAVGSIHAQTTTPPGGNIDAPLHTGPSQIKDGGLSVNAFAAYQDASFNQQVFFNGAVFGGQPGAGSSTVSIGDANAPANIAADGAENTSGTITSASVANQSNHTLCADTSGTIIICGNAAPAPTPTSYISLQPNDDAAGDLGLVAELTTPVTVPVTVNFTATYSPVSTLFGSIGSYFTADAKSISSCSIGANGESASVTIPADGTTSDVWYAPQGCPAGTVSVNIDSYSPQTDGTTAISAFPGVLIIN
jgi:hypothetical protein